ncbi:MAG TPA: methyltransferase domain-containing protein [Burkholderiaceae bacterium]|nr:methyltransferase domain-containing protein [Burkholderiaceae bacterium]
MRGDSSIRFFDEQFQRQVRDADLQLNPFEQATLPYLRGRVLDYGCGLGNLALAAARRGCSVLALDASPTAIRHLRAMAAAESLPIEALEVDLRTHQLHEQFDSVVAIGLLMFFDCPTALAQLAQLQSHVRRDGIAVINVLVEGTTFVDMFDPAGHCLFARDEMPRRFAGWEILRTDYQDFPAPGERVKSFVTLIARKPLHNAVASPRQ